MRRPDFACSDLGRMPDQDLKFLIENMPSAGGSYQEIAAVINDLPSTLESILTSDYVFDLIRDRQSVILDISPFLLFSVLLRRSMGRPRSALERRVVNYLANLLTLFIRTDRVFRIAPDEAEPHAYVWELVEQGEQADARRQFLTYAHIGNYALWLTGLQADWLRHRHRYGRRVVSPDYYVDFGRAYFDRAARHRMAEEFGLDDVFLRLAMMFQHYQKGLSHMQREFMPLS